MLYPYNTIAAYGSTFSYDESLLIKNILLEIVEYVAQILIAFLYNFSEKKCPLLVCFVALGNQR